MTRFVIDPLHITAKFRRTRTGHERFEGWADSADGAPLAVAGVESDVVGPGEDFVAQAGENLGQGFRRVGMARPAGEQRIADDSAPSEAKADAPRRVTGGVYYGQHAIP